MITITTEIYNKNKELLYNYNQLMVDLKLNYLCETIYIITDKLEISNSPEIIELNEKIKKDLQELKEKIISELK